MREAALEKKLRQAIEKDGGLCLKFVSPGWTGAPDRIVLTPGKKIWFAEMKAPGEKPDPIQLKRKRQLEALGFQVEVIDYDVSAEGLPEIRD